MLHGGDWENGGGEGFVQCPLVLHGRDVLRDCWAGRGEQLRPGAGPPAGE